MIRIHRLFCGRGVRSVVVLLCLSVCVLLVNGSNSSSSSTAAAGSSTTTAALDHLDEVEDASPLFGNALLDTSALFSSYHAESSSLFTPASKLFQAQVLAKCHNEKKKKEYQRAEQIVDKLHVQTMMTSKSLQQAVEASTARIAQFKRGIIRWKRVDKKLQKVQAHLKVAMTTKGRLQELHGKVVAIKEKLLVIRKQKSSTRMKAMSVTKPVKGLANVHVGTSGRTEAEKVAATATKLEKTADSTIQQLEKKEKKLRAKLAKLYNSRRKVMKAYINLRKERRDYKNLISRVHKFKLQDTRRLQYVKNAQIRLMESRNRVKLLRDKLESLIQRVTVGKKKLIQLFNLLFQRHIKALRAEMQSKVKAETMKKARRNVAESAPSKSKKKALAKQKRLTALVATLRAARSKAVLAKDGAASSANTNAKSYHRLFDMLLQSRTAKEMAYTKMDQALDTKLEASAAFSHAGTFKASGHDTLAARIKEARQLSTRFKSRQKKFGKVAEQLEKAYAVEKTLRTKMEGIMGSKKKTKRRLRHLRAKLVGMKTKAMKHEETLAIVNASISSKLKEQQIVLQRIDFEKIKVKTAKKRVDDMAKVVEKSPAEIEAAVKKYAKAMETESQFKKRAEDAEYKADHVDYLYARMHADGMEESYRTKAALAKQAQASVFKKEELAVAAKRTMIRLKMDVKLALMSLKVQMNRLAKVKKETDKLTLKFQRIKDQRVLDKERLKQIAGELKRQNALFVKVSEKAQEAVDEVSKARLFTATLMPAYYSEQVKLQQAEDQVSLIEGEKKVVLANHLNRTLAMEALNEKALHASRVFGHYERRYNETMHAYQTRKQAVNSARKQLDDTDRAYMNTLIAVDLAMAAEKEAETDELQFKRTLGKLDALATHKAYKKMEKKVKAKKCTTKKCNQQANVSFVDAADSAVTDQLATMEGMMDQAAEADLQLDFLDVDTDAADGNVIDLEQDGSAVESRHGEKRVLLDKFSNAEAQRASLQMEDEIMHLQKQVKGPVQWVPVKSLPRKFQRKQTRFSDVPAQLANSDGVEHEATERKKPNTIAKEGDPVSTEYKPYVRAEMKTSKHPETASFLEVDTAIEKAEDMVDVEDEATCDGKPCDGKAVKIAVHHVGPAKPRFKVQLYKPASATPAPKEVAYEPAAVIPVVTLKPLQGTAKVYEPVKTFVTEYKTPAPAPKFVRPGRLVPKVKKVEEAKVVTVGAPSNDPSKGKSYAGGQAQLYKYTGELLN